MTPAPTAVRLARADDAAALAALLLDGRAHFTGRFPPGYLDAVSEASQRAGLQRALAEHEHGRRWPGIVVDTATGAVIGRVSLHDIVGGNRRSCFIAYWIGAGHTGRGHATRAAAAACDLAFAELALHRVEAFVRPDNAASLAVVRRCGFEYIGLARQHTLVGDGWQDETIWQLLEPAGRG